MGKADQNIPAILHVLALLGTQFGPPRLAEYFKGPDRKTPVPGRPKQESHLHVSLPSHAVDDDSIQASIYLGLVTSTDVRWKSLKEAC